MKEYLKEEKNNNISHKLKIMYIIIILICIISVIAAVIIQTKTDEEKEKTEISKVKEEQISTYQDEFDSIFENKVNYMENNHYKITKNKQDEEIVYIGYQLKETKMNDYELDVNIPYINIVNETTEKFNEQIKEIFEQKARSVVNSQGNNIIYTVNYSAYVTNNILSLVVRSTLREGNHPQRDIVQTYNYDLADEKEFTMENFLALKGISKQDANKRIKTEIEKVQKQVEQLAALGYSVYTRNPDDDIYSINNVTEYFIGKDNALYIIFAYGNENNTNEMDIVII